MTQDIDTSRSLLAALDRGESLPSRWYTDPSITEREITHVFRKSWNYIGPLSQLTELGDYITGYAGGVPIVVVRNDRGLAGFVNVCRHRRHEVMKGRGNAKTMQCGYHAWTYDLAGSLKRVPRAAAEPNFNLGDFPLLPIRAEALGPFVFVHLDHEAPPVQACYGPVLDIISGSGVVLDSLVTHGREEWRSNANWKSMLENYLECYHCAIAHPSFSKAIDVAPETYALEEYPTFSTQFGPPKNGGGGIYDATGEIDRGQFHLLFPGTTLNVMPGRGNFSIGPVIPLGNERTYRFLDYFFLPDTDPQWIADYLELDTQVGGEDRVLVERVQVGMRSGIVTAGTLMPESERLIGHFERLLVDALGADG